MSEVSDTEATIYVEVRKPGMKARDGHVCEVGEIISHTDLGMKEKNLPAAHRRGSIAVKDQATFDTFKATGRKDPHVTGALLDPDSPIIYGLRGMPDHFKPDTEAGNESDYGDQIPGPNTDPNKHKEVFNEEEPATPAGHEVAIPEEALIPRPMTPMPDLSAVSVSDTPPSPPPPPEPPGTAPSEANAATINVPDEPLRDGMNVKEYWEKAPEDPNRKNGRLCYHCGEPVYPKSTLWEHCPDKSLMI